MTCALLHNFIRIEMPYDSLEAEIPEVDDEISDDPDIAFIDQVKPSQQWMNWMNRKNGVARNECILKTCRRDWTVEEERVLANAMKAQVVNGYKADNKFKSGKNYGSLSTMRSMSGFGWNDTTKMITIDDESVWADYVKIFGKDRATGEAAEGFADVVQVLFNKDVNNEKGKDNDRRLDYEPVFNHSQFDEVQNMSFLHANTSGSSKSEKRKRKIVDENDDRFIDLMTSFCDKSDDRLGDISKCIGFEHDASKSTKVVFEALGQVTSLDMEEMILVSQLIVNNTKNINLFFSLPNIGKITMVKVILEGKFPVNS
ncbi:hypothetical protein BUALT_Bualt12G0064600 [Buddleja alternifolia]|uniref:Myb/SANT-like domain-containing protein n=1 Tax=Buddleja alternifolia TaxID=168488 RepID=A0AAV6WQE7_9LAMI|nr:hypothetical protein BUALT_Bualt12G0064600 [Buddleja alternifolia]